MINFEFMKRLYRSDTNRVISGVLGGIGEYYDTDPTILRLAYIVFTILTGFFPAVVGYIVAILIVPKKHNVHHVHHSEKTETKHEEKKEEPKSE